MTVKQLDRQLQDQIQHTIDTKTKPVGALGKLENLALQLSLIQSQTLDSAVDKINLDKPLMLVFAGDHGINQHNLSIAPSAVTRQMVMNFLHGGAAINCFCSAADIELNVIDCGILQAVDGQYANLIEQRLGNGTDDFSQQAAMNISQVEQGFLFGQQLVNSALAQKRSVLLLGEMGIANTSSASAIFTALTEKSIEQCVGKGTGITDAQLALKIKLIKVALERLTRNISNNDLTENKQSSLEHVKQVLSEVGGFEIVQMVGTILAAAKAKLPVVIDGFIVSVAALAAVTIDKNVNDYLIYSHVSQEKGHQLLLSELNATPLLSLDLRLGEGTGAALAFPILKAAASFYNDMASFESAGVTDRS